MVIKVALSDADYQTLNHRATICRHRIETYVEEVLAVTAADLRRPQRCRLTREMAWARKADPVESPADDPEPVSGWKVGRSVEQLDRLHKRALRAAGR